MWTQHLWNLLINSWNATTTGYGTTTLGFILWVVLFTALLWFASVLGTWFNLRKTRTPRPVWGVLRDSLPTGLLSAGCIGLIVAVSYSYYLIHTVYQDHQSNVSHMAAHDKANANLTVQLEVRKHSMVAGEPVFGNTIYLLMAFDSFRHAQKESRA